ncbi:hypothetical protein IEO21_00935 [Rhodonia placenta]|uniref:Cullin family profile domain-containing protein n=1 Tax=Rhodonia placenta TaxID=104341 RepID=A0A8H7PAC6_9APHY|nr:hypothetical protein IEO21_00935 [Postia placenta]
MVLNSQTWPTSLQCSDSTLVPAAVLPVCTAFTEFFLKRHTGRKLTWLWNLSRGELQTNYFDKRYILSASFLQMSILLQYNDQNSFGLNELIAATGIAESNLKPLLTGLTKVGILIKDGFGCYELNLNYTSQKTRVNLLTSGNNPEQKAERRAIQETVGKDRKYLLEVTAVRYEPAVGATLRTHVSDDRTRVMKTERTLKEQLLIQSIVSEVSKRFMPQVSDVKKVCHDVFKERCR